jgi:precorrin-2/cobalt-factor-2 C20-methyltransferase
MSERTGTFYGIGVGPGTPGLLPVAAWETLLRCEVIFAPRARTLDYSVARRCLPANEIPEERFREIEFVMDPDRSVLSAHYAALAGEIAAELRAGKNVAYLTLGDSLTYSTYGYTLAALEDCLPGFAHKTYPGVTSYSALAAACDFPLGEGKERVLILPCPDSAAELREAIEANDVVVLMKISDRLSMVLQCLRDLGIEEHCVFGRRVGMPEELLFHEAGQIPAEKSLGYFSTMLIRRVAREQRHPGVEL